MGTYNALGKGLLGLFIGLTNLLSPPPLPKPDAVVLTPAQTIPIQAIPKINIISTKVISSTTPVVASSTKQKTIWVYLNYPEKISITPAKTVDQNFKKIFQYSIQSKPTISQSVTPVVSLPNIETVSNQKSVLDSIVNIYCTIQIGQTIKAVTGSGVIIDPRGIVLTNAHVGEFPLLQGTDTAKNMNCSIRTGSPTNAAYGIKTLFVSKEWINQNYRNISQTNFSETGENDIALLQITDKKTGASVSKLSYAPLSNQAPSIGDYISIASYPADILSTRGISALLTLQTEQLRVSNAFSFSYNTSADLIETTDSNTAGHGSSGGALLDNSGKLAGIIVITVNGDNTGTKHARALTTTYISGILQKDTGLGLSSFLSQDMTDMTQRFNSDKNSLINQLISGGAASFF